MTNHRPKGFTRVIAALVAVPVGMLIRAQFPDGTDLRETPMENPDVRVAPVAPTKKLPRLLPPDNRTAVYDIAAHTVYLPGGLRLEAHSGMGSYLDDPRYVDVRELGPTPPNVYNLVLRERLFHGVRAIRLVPADDRKMHGRKGILAHSYMLGPTGQSNGCVSFRDYPLFLDAFLKGEVERLVVV